MIYVRVFTEQGVDEFKNYLHALKEGKYVIHPDLNHEPYSCPFVPKVEIDENRIFDSRMDMAEYLVQRFEEAGISRIKVAAHDDLWTWFAYIWFNQICPVTNGKRRVREIQRYICGQSWKRYYRHLIAEPYNLYSSLGRKNSRLFLHSPVYEHNDFTEQFGSRQYIISHPNIIEAAHMLYWDEKHKSPKKGIQTKTARGNHRRLMKVIDQLELTYDVYSMKPNRILDLLPEEFDRWKHNE